MNSETHDLTVTVGIPVFNGEAYIRAQALAFETISEERSGVD
jgi:hypothetical protein